MPKFNSSLYTVIIENINLFTGAFAELQGVRGPAAQPVDTIISNYPAFLFKLPALDGLPSTGLTYTFGTPVSAATEPSDTRSFVLFPNPVRGQLYFSEPAAGAAVLQLIDSQGRVVWRQALEAGSASVGLPAVIPNGMYLLRRLSVDRTEQAWMAVQR